VQGQDLDLSRGCKVYRGWVRISQLAESAGVPTSTVRYYERVGLMVVPVRTASGYRDYAEDAAARLRFVTRARRMGLSCEQITALIPVWAGTNCGAAHERVGRLVDQKQAEIAERIIELQQFSAQLDAVRASLDAEPPLSQCRTDLTCCVPESPGGPVAIELVPRR
jgi:DNA-binding transcriptional MerR regulator